MEKKECPCPYKDCVRNGNCDECKKYHHSAGEKTYCEKQKRNDSKTGK
jgi:hypothetical protein